MENFLKGITKKAKSAAQSVGEWFSPTEKTRVRDVVREIPGETGKMAKTIAQSIPRSILSTFLTIAPEKVKENIGEIKPEEDFGTVGKMFLGEEPIQTIPMLGKETLKGFGASEETSKKFGPIVGIGLTAADLWPGTAGKGKVGIKAAEEIIPKLVKEATPEGIVKILVKSGAEEKAAKEAAEGLAKATTEGEVKTLLGIGDNTQKTTKVAAKEATQSQAKDTTLYHTTTPEAAKAIREGGFRTDLNPEDTIGRAFGDGAYFSTTKDEAEAWKQFVTNDGKGEIIDITSKLNIYDPKVENPADYWYKLAKKGKVKITEGQAQEIADAYLMGKESLEPDVYDDAIKNSQDIIKGLTDQGIDGAKFIEPIDASEGIENPQVVVFNVGKLNDALKGGTNEFRYHETSATNLKNIQKQGLNPSKGQYGNGVYFSPEIGKGEASGRGMIIRAKKDDLAKSGFDEFVNKETGAIDEGWADKNVPANILEYSTDGGKTWKPVSEKVTGVKGAKSVGEIIDEGGKVPPTKTSKAVAGTADNEAERRLITRVKEANPTMEGLLSGKYQRRSTKELVDNADKIIKENSAQAEQMARTGTDDQSVAVAMRMIDNLTTEAKAATGAAKDALYEKAANIANDAARNLTESGRSVQAASIYSRMTPEGMVRYAAREIQKYNEEIAGKRTMKNFFGTTKKIPELNGQQIKDITEEMEKIGKMADGTEKNRAVYNLQEKVRKLIPSSIYDKIVSFWKAGLLTGLKTTGVNLASNLSNTVSEIAKDIPASFVDKIVSLFTGKRSMVLTTDKSLKGAAEGVAKGWDFLKTGFDERNTLSKLDYKKVNFGNGKIAKAAQTYTDTVFGLLGAEDQPFYYSAKARSLASQAAAEAKNEGLKGKEAVKFAQNLIENPTDDMIKYATLDAETAVFQQESWLAKRGRGAQKLFGQIILPFAKTPANVADAMISYSPAGIVRTIIQNIGKGKFDQRLFSQGIGRGITGTAALAIGAELYNKGMMALSYPTSEKERKQWELEGKTMNSIKVGGKWRNVGVLGPLGMVAVVGGHLQQGIEDTGSFTGGLVNAAGGAGSSLTDQTFLSGVNKVVDALNDPSRSFEGFASSLAGSIVPTLVADFARATDKYERQTSGAMQRLQSRIPGAREGLEPRVDTFGEKIPTPNFFTVMADATRPGTPLLDENDIVLKEIKRLAENEYQVTPTQLGPNKGYESLSDAENRYLLQVAGKYARKAIEDTITHRSYNRLDDEQKAKEITNAVDDAKVEARARAIYEFTKGLSAEEARQKLAKMKEDKLLTNQVYDAYLSYKRRQ